MRAVMKKAAPRRPAPWSHLGTVLQAPGQPLEDGLRARLERRFHYDFSGVRTHSDGAAASSAHAVDALAYTVGRHVVFGRGQFRPETRQGRGLIAHELAHVIQQDRGGPALPSTARIQSLESEADRAAAQVGRDQPVSIAGHSASGLARQPRSQRESLNIAALSDAELRREMQEIRQWLGGRRGSSVDGEHLASVLGDLGREWVRRHPDVGPPGIPPMLGLVSAARVAQAEAALEATSTVAAAAPVAAPAAGAAGAAAEAGAAETVGEAAAIGLGATAAAGLAFVLVLFWPSDIAPEPPVPRAPPRPRDDTKPDTSPRAEPTTRAEPRATPRDERRSCATQHPGVRLCDSLPGGYTFSSPQAALAELKRRTGNQNLSLRNPSPSTSGPCPGTGMHYNVRSGSTQIASIVCCPCCIDTPTGPVLANRCRIV
jgi:hypothetical protein